MNFEDFSWFPILTDADVGDYLRLRDGTTYASVAIRGTETWIATVNLHRPLLQQRSADFASKGEAKAAVHAWLRGVRTRH